MRIRYYKDTDALLITFKEEPVYGSEYLEEFDIVVDYNRKDEVVGVEVFDWHRGRSKGKGFTQVITFKEEPVYERKYLEEFGIQVNYNKKNEVVGLEIFDRFTEGEKEEELIPEEPRKSLSGKDTSLHV